MKKFLAPLGVFFAGMVLLLISTIFNPAIGNAVAATQAQIGDKSATFWGLDWALNSERLIIFIIGIALVLLDANGRFKARLEGSLGGNVLLRQAQFRAADDPAQTRDWLVRGLQTQRELPAVNGLAIDAW